MCSLLRQFHVMMRGINHQNIDIEDSSRSRPSDDQVWQMIIEMVGVTNSSAFQVLEDKSKRMVFKELKDKGASYRQLERLTGGGRGLIQKL